MGHTAGSFVSTVVLWVVFLLLYLIPFFIANCRRHHQRLAIGWLNLLAGWTFVGWVVAFVWACTAIPASARAARRAPGPLVSPTGVIVPRGEYLNTLPKYLDARRPADPIHIVYDRARQTWYVEDAAVGAAAWSYPYPTLEDCMRNWTVRLVGYNQDTGIYTAEPLNS